jgi:hypothetical protein
VIVSIYIYVLTPTTVLAFVGVKITEGLCFFWYYIVVVVNVSVYVCALSVEKNYNLQVLLVSKEPRGRFLVVFFKGMQQFCNVSPMMWWWLGVCMVWCWWCA